MIINNVLHIIQLMQPTILNQLKYIYHDLKNGKVGKEFRSTPYTKYYST